MDIPTLTGKLSRSPMTDPRSLSGSILFHTLFVLAASAAVLGVSRPKESETPKAVTAELDPVDNLAKPESGEGGGNPGEIGDERLATVTPPPGEPVDAAAPRDPSAEALLAEIVPTPVAPDTTSQTLPGPQTSNLGILPGPGTGTGGGGGSGGGIGGGVGGGVGPGTEFFGAREHAGSFAYVIDRSGSMATRNSLEIAKREVSNSLNRLPPDARFAVIFYDVRAAVLSDPNGHRGLMPATAANKARVGSQLPGVVPDGGTDHLLAIRTALGLKPEVIFFLTDAETMSDGEVTLLLNEAGRTRIQAIEFGRGVELGNLGNPLKRLATKTGGTYRYIDVLRFPSVR